MERLWNSGIGKWLVTDRKQSLMGSFSRTSSSSSSGKKNEEC